MNKMSQTVSSFFVSLSSLNLKGVLKGGSLYEPITPEMRDKQAAEKK